MSDYGWKQIFKNIGRLFLEQIWCKCAIQALISLEEKYFGSPISKKKFEKNILLRLFPGKLAASY